MKILFLTSSNGGGRGGHNHSLNHISQAISNKAEVRIVNIGLTESPILRSNRFYIKGVKYRWYDLLTLNNQLKEIFVNFKPEVVHCFDGGAALMLMLLPCMRDIKLLYTKCGGPNERGIILPFTENIILFSEENKKAYSSTRRLDGAKIHLLPNRIYDVPLANTSNRLLEKDNNFFNIVRIARIGRTYKQSLVQTINLANVLSETQRIKVTFIGHVENSEVLAELKKHAISKAVSVEFVTDNESTSQASKLLYLADAVVGTGRGVMEAMLHSLPVFVPIINSDLPCLLTEKSFNTLFSTNFSPRGRVDHSVIEEGLVIAKSMIGCNDKLEGIAKFSEAMAREHFLIGPRVINSYLDIYRMEKTMSRAALVVKNILGILYYFNAFRVAQKLLRQ